MHRHVIAFVMVAVPLASALGIAQTPAPAPLPSSGAAAVDLRSLDRRVDACTDFYQFACGGWVAANPLPADRPRFDRFTELQQRNFAILRRILETAGGEGDLKKARDYYAACVDEAAMDALGIKPIAPELARIAAVKNRAGLPEIVARLHRLVGESATPGNPRRAGQYVFFAFGARPQFEDATREMATIGSDGLTLPSRDYYTRTDDRSVTQRSMYRRHVGRMLQLAGDDPATAAKGADAVLAIETRLANVTLDAARRRDPNALRHSATLEALQTLTPAFNWRRYLRAAGAPPFATINLSEPEFLAEMERLITSVPLDDLKSYLRWHLVHGSSSRLAAPFREETFDFFNRTLTGQQERQPRWRECIADTDRQLGEALGKAFVEEVFSPQARSDMLVMVQDIKLAMRRDITDADWMSEETRRAAHAKLDAVVDRIGYPDHWRSYAAMAITRTTALANLQHALAFHNARRLARIGQPVDRGEWSMTPPTVNAYYSSTANTINFPAGILQPPFYQPGGDPALGYGAIGAVIGHELSHGFDDQGRKYDGQGNLRDWWSRDDAVAYEERSSCIANQYSGYTVAGDTAINGRLTLGENTADNGGLRLALMAYLAGPAARQTEAASTLDGFTPEQRVFLGWAQQWCENTRRDAERLKAASNPHAANLYRVNGVVSNMPEFAAAFSCAKGSAMVRENACRVW
jgi:endothelin-converting enzyme/putative endopeptidase